MRSQAITNDRPRSWDESGTTHQICRLVRQRPFMHLSYLPVMVIHQKLLSLKPASCCVKSQNGWKDCNWKYLPRKGCQHSWERCRGRLQQLVQDSSKWPSTKLQVICNWQISTDEIAHLSHYHLPQGISCSIQHCTRYIAVLQEIAVQNSSELHEWEW